MKQAIKWASVAISVWALVACGGGGGDAGTSPFGTGASGGTSTGTGTTGAIAITSKLSLSLSSTTVTSTTPATVTATLQDATGAAIANQVVTFSSAQSLGTFSSPSALTDASGKASVVLYPSTNTTVGADTVTATSTVNAAALTASVGFQLTPTNVTISSFTSDVGSGTLAAYGQTTLTVLTTGAAAGTAVKVSLSSACATAGKAVLSATSASTTNGVATFTYQDQGCGSLRAADAIQATVSGTATSTPLGITLAAPVANSVTFVSASPETIYLRGSGFIDTSTVTFQVVDFAGNSLPNQSVSMVATTYTGGLTLDGSAAPVTKVSDGSGKVTVIVSSGTVPTPVRVKATLVSRGITASSSNLTVTVGLPAQINFSLSQATLNIEGGSIDGTPNTYNVIASDRMGNPVTAGTTINFISSGSQIVGASQVKLDANGNASASVTLKSSAPRSPDGRITIVAYAVGEESFNDLNGNNVYDAGEDFQDLGDVFVSSTFSSTYNPATDQLVPFTLGAAPQSCVNGSALKLRLDASTPSAAAVNGGARCDGVWGQSYVRRAVQTVLSTSSARPVWQSPPAVTNGVCRTVTLQDDVGTGVYYVLDPAANYAVGTAASGVLNIIVADANPVRLNPMAAGSSVTVSSTNGLAVTVLGGSPVASTLSATSLAISYAFTPPVASGVLTVNLRSPSGLVSSYSLNLSQSAGTQCP